MKADSKINREAGLVLKGLLYARVLRRGEKVWKDLGLIAERCVTNAGVAFLVDRLQDGAALNVFRYHDSGTGTAAESAADTGLGTPTGEARDTGSLEEGVSANIFKTKATHTYAGTFAITEHGVFSAAAIGTLWDRSKFTAINVYPGDKIEWTYLLNCIAGG